MKTWKKRGQESIEHARMGTLVDMAGSVAHEINNPLTIILGWVQLLNNSVEKKDLQKKILLVWIIFFSQFLE